MASAYVTSLTTARDSYAAKLASLASADANKLTYTENGRSMSWTEYQTFLIDTITKLDQQIAAHTPRVLLSRSRAT